MHLHTHDHGDVHISTYTITDIYISFHLSYPVMHSRQNLVCLVWSDKSSCPLALGLPCLAYHSGLILHVISSLPNLAHLARIVSFGKHLEVTEPSCMTYYALSVLLCLICPVMLCWTLMPYQLSRACQASSIASWVRLSCNTSPVLSCLALPVMPILSCQSHQACPVLPCQSCHALPILSCLPCSVMPSLFCPVLYCSNCPAVLWLSCHA